MTAWSAAIVTVVDVLRPDIVRIGQRCGRSPAKEVWREESLHEFLLPPHFIAKREQVFVICKHSLGGDIR
jgi:hypothetical protein